MAFTTDTRPLDCTSYAGRAGAEADPAYGMGCIPGYARVSVYDHEKPQYPVSNFAPGTAAAWFEYEDGDIGGGVVHKTDPRYFPRDAAGELARVRVIAKAVRLGLSHRFDGRNPPVPLLWYRPVMLRPGQYGAAYRDALRAQAASGIFDVFDAIVIDAHPRINEAFAVWCGLLDEQVAAVAAVCKKPLVAVINDAWGPNDGVERYRPLPAAEAAPRYAYARRHKGLWTVARMGGYDDGGPGGWRRLAWGSHPAEAEINAALGARGAL